MNRCAFGLGCESCSTTSPASLFGFLIVLPQCYEGAAGAATSGDRIDLSSVVGRPLRASLPAAAQIATPDQSGNRSGTGGKFWTVLIADPGVDAAKRRKQLNMGVLCYTAGDCQHSFQQPGQSRFDFRFESDALDHNFHHCELRVYRDGIRMPREVAKGLRGEEKSAWRLAELSFRDAVSKLHRQTDKSIVVLKAEIATTGKTVVPH